MSNTPELALGRAALHASSPIFVFDARMHIVDCNAAVAAMYGVERSALLDVEVSSGGLHAAMTRVIAGERAVWSGTHPLAGRGLSATFRLAPIVNDAGAVVGGYVTVDAEGERLENARVAEALATVDIERRRLRATLESLPIAVWMSDAGGTIHVVNAAAVAMMGGRAPRVRPSRYHEYRFYRPGSNEPLVGDDFPLTRSLRDGVTVESFPLDFERADGVRRHGLCSIAPIRDASGVITGGVIALLDNTDQLLAQRALHAMERHAQKMDVVGQLAGGIAHDFNNLLAVISASAEFLEDGLPVDSPHVQDAREIQAAVERAGELTRRLLTFSRRDIARARPVEMNEIAATALQRVVGPAVRFDDKIADTHVLVDPAQLEQVIANFAVNARDASAKTLTVSTRAVTLEADIARARGVKPGRFIELVVTDDGGGIAEATLPRVFEPFFTTKGVGRGAGLGLSTVYGIAKQGGGYVAVESVVGKGASFTFALPHLVPVRTIAPDPLPVAGRILVVDDEPGVRTLSRRILERAGYEVSIAESPSEALQLMSREIDLVLTDFTMPEMNGRELQTEILRRFPDARVMIMSGYIDDAVVRQQSSEGAIYLAKPFAAADLLAAVARALSQPRARTA